MQWRTIFFNTQLEEIKKIVSHLKMSLLFLKKFFFYNFNKQFDTSGN